MIEGSCLCGRVRYRGARAPGPYVYCHCRSCRKANGSAFAANIPLRADDFEILSGADEIRSYESSPSKFRFFCGNCGSPLYTKVGASSHVVRVRLGTVDTGFDEPPAAHIFVSENPAWHEISDAAPRFDGWPDPSIVRVPGSRQGA